MKLIVGLGNPGKDYENTRHNIGYMLLEKYKKDCCGGGVFVSEKKFNGDLLKSGEVMLFKPTTFMNKSGEAVSKLIGYYNINLDDVLVVHDDLDIKLGEWKLVKGVGPKVHNGINSVEDQLGNIDFYRVRIGIEAREGEKKNIPGEKYVLSRFSNEEMVVMDKVFNELVKAIKEWCATD